MNLAHWLPYTAFCIKSENFSHVNDRYTLVALLLNVVFSFLIQFHIPCLGKYFLCKRENVRSKEIAGLI